MDLAQRCWVAVSKGDPAAAAGVLETVREKNMAPWYAHLCQHHPGLFPLDEALLAKMKETNEAEMKRISEVNYEKYTAHCPVSKDRKKWPSEIIDITFFFPQSGRGRKNVAHRDEIGARVGMGYSWVRSAHGGVPRWINVVLCVASLGFGGGKIIQLCVLSSHEIRIVF